MGRPVGLFGLLPGAAPVRLPRLRAPARHGAVLAHPPLTDLPGLLERNRTMFRSGRVSPALRGESLAELRRLAVGEVLAAARDYLRGAGEPAPDSAAGSLFLSGHQPELFHPGVWLKNFALNALARWHGAVPLNLVVDNDTAKATTIRVPALGGGHDPANVHLAFVPFDHFAGEVAYEERAVHDEELFASFPRHVAELTADWPCTPILAEFWADVLRQRGRTALLGERFAAARRAWERRWGCHNFELPLSRLCRTEAFARFAVALLADLPAFHAAYNDAVRDYRRRYGVRSRNHPVPDLARDGDWLEAPFWAWRAGAPRRRRLFVRPAPGGWQLRAGDDRWPDLPRDGAAERWPRFEAEGYKVRTRALTTTLFARLLMADLFVHGIGGGKYDELNDAILARHFGIDPPAYLVLTGTLHLPLPAYPATTKTWHEQQRMVRDLYWNPQRHLPAEVAALPDVGELLTKHRALEGRQPQTAAERSQQYHQFRELSDRVRPYVAGELESAHRAAERAATEVKANAVLRRRDYAFCLFPESALRPFLTQCDRAPA